MRWANSLIVDNNFARNDISQTRSKTPGGFILIPLKVIAAFRALAIWTLWSCNPLIHEDVRIDDFSFIVLVRLANNDRHAGLVRYFFNSADSRGEEIVLNLGTRTPRYSYGSVWELWAMVLGVYFSSLAIFLTRLCRILCQGDHWEHEKRRGRKLQFLRNINNSRVFISFSCNRYRKRLQIKEMLNTVSTFFMWCNTGR